MKSTQYCFTSIDEALGPSQERFFSAGFRKVKHGLHDIEIGNKDEQGVIRGVASVTYPTDWSKKEEGRALQPHLSSIDGLVLSAQLVEIYLQAAYGLNNEQRKRIWMRRFLMKSGQAAHYQLEGFIVGAQHLSTLISQDTRCGYISKFKAQIGGINLYLEFEHDMGDLHRLTGRFQNVEDVLGVSEKRYYGEGYKQPIQQINDIKVDLGALQATAQVRVENACMQRLGEGQSAFYQPYLSYIDCMAGIAQLAQVLLYKLDSIDRKSSNNLWMREIHMENGNPANSQDYFLASTQISKSRLINIKGKTWRSADMVGNFHGINTRYAVAHELPAGDVGL